MSTLRSAASLTGVSLHPSVDKAIIEQVQGKKVDINTVYTNAMSTTNAHGSLRMGALGLLFTIAGLLTWSHFGMGLDKSTNPILIAWYYSSPLFCLVAITIGACFERSMYRANQEIYKIFAPCEEVPGPATLGLGAGRFLGLTPVHWVHLTAFCVYTFVTVDQYFHIHMKYISPLIRG